jgi:NADPH2:quinone reductase
VKAIRIEAPGGPEVLQWVDLPVPDPGPGEVLVRSRAIGVGKPDVLFRTGVYRWLPPLPATPGAEMMGEVIALGDGVSGLTPGQPVLVYALKGGCYAEYNAVPVSAVTPLPEGIDPAAAVTIPNYQVAHALLTEAARGVNPRWIYINGAAGGVGSAVIQLCRLRGVPVIAGASSAEKCAFALAQGATHAIDYSREAVVERVLELTGGRGVDLSLDHLIGPTFTESLGMLAPLGLIVSFNMLAGWPEQDLFRAMRAHLPKSPAVRCFTMHSYDADPATRNRLMAETLDYFVRGAVRPAIFREMPLAQARAAHELLDARAVLGKLVLRP